MNIASVFRRIIGGVVDSILMIFFSMIYVVIFGEKMLDGTYHITGFSAILLFVLIYLYFVIMEAKTGRTIGKYVAKTKVVNERGQKISWGQSLVRNFIRVVDGLFFYVIGLLAILISKKNQRLGDMVSKTYVIAL